MKTMIVYLWLFGVLTCGAQTKPSPRAEDFRIVDGKLYNIQTSTNWQTLPRESGEFYSYDWRVEEVFDGGTVMEITCYKAVYSKGNGFSGGERIGRREDSRRRVWVKNIPRELVVTGKSLPRMRVLHMGVRQNNGEILEAYDCGLTNTPENRVTLKPPVVQK